MKDILNDRLFFFLSVFPRVRIVVLADASATAGLLSAFAFIRSLFHPRSPSRVSFCSLHSEQRTCGTLVIEFYSAATFSIAHHFIFIILNVHSSLYSLFVFFCLFYSCILQIFSRTLRLIRKQLF